jgi:hypothetical protein
MIIFVKQRPDRLIRVHQRELEVHYTTTKDAKEKQNKISTWIGILSDEDAPICELAEMVDTSLYVGPHGEEPKRVLWQTYPVQMLLTDLASMCFMIN